MWWVDWIDSFCPKLRYFTDKNEPKGGPFGPFWPVKYLGFGPKLSFQSTHHTFLESRHPEVTKKSIICFVPQVEPKKVSVHKLL